MNWKSTCRSVVWALSATAVLSSCSDQGIVGGEWGGVTRIELTPSTIQLNAGEAQTISVRALNASGEEVRVSDTDNLTINWSSADSSVARVEGSGASVQVRGVSAGSARISVTVSPRSSRMRLTAGADVVVKGTASAVQAAGGDNQTGVVGQALPQNLAVRIINDDGEGVSGVTVNFATTDGGKLDPASASTDDSGVAKTSWQLGPKAGVQRVTASATGAASVEFKATATAASPDTIRIQTGTGQTGTIGQQLRDTLVVRVADRFGNAVPNVPVTWAVASGGGTVTPVAPNTSSEGIARAVWKLGDASGTQTVRASTGNLSTMFAATATTSEPNNPDPEPVAPSTVTDLRVVSATTNSVTLAWTAVSDGDGGAAKYAIRTGSPTISWGSAYQTERSVDGRPVGDTVTYTYTGLNPATTYQFQLVSYRGTLNQGAVFGNRSNIVTRATSAPAVASVTVTPSSHKFTQIGQTLQLVATAKDASGSTLSGVSFSWSSSNSSIVSVDNMGKITARAAGTALVVVCAAGCDAADTTSVSVDPEVPSPPSVATISATPSSHVFTAIGQTQQITVTARDQSGQVVSGAQYTWTSTAPGIVSVDNNGRMTSRAAGTAAIIVAATCCSIADTVNAVVQVNEPPPSGSGTPLFSDNFDNGRFNSANGFSWNGANERVTISSTYAYSGTHSMRFRFGPDGPGEDSWAEERFTITPNASSAPKEVWIEYMWRVPENYVHRSGGAANNKFMTLWAENYSAAQEAQFYLSLERSSDTNSRLDILAVHGDDPRYPNDSRFMGPNFVTPSDYGRWVQIRIHARIARDGSIRVWKNGTLVTQVQNYNMERAGGSRNYFRHGYLMGWSNSGYTQQTDFYIDDFKVYTSNPGW